MLVKDFCNFFTWKHKVWDTKKYVYWAYDDKKLKMFYVKSKKKIVKIPINNKEYIYFLNTSLSININLDSIKSLYKI